MQIIKGGWVVEAGLQYNKDTGIKEDKAGFKRFHHFGGFFAEY